MTRFILAATFWCMATIATADIVVSFDEGAPTDRFTILNDGACALVATDLVLDLGTSAAGLIFDTTDGGDGVQVFQPLTIVAGQEALAEVPKLRDGDNSLTLRLGRLEPGQSIAFTTDVDDTRGQRATVVSNAEIEGARVKIAQTGADAQFGAQSTARVPHDACAV